MKRFASILAATALCAALLFYSITHWNFPPIGFEWTLFLAGISLWLSAISATLAGLICIGLFFHKRVRLTWQFLCAAAAGILLYATTRLGI